MANTRIGIIGGSGLYDIEGLTNIGNIKPYTPFGAASDTIIIGQLDGIDVAFLPRHGRNHTLLPSEIPNRANIYALKMLGIENIIAVNSCGSLKENIKPGDIVIPDQIIDRTRNRVSTFFGSGIVGHIPFSQPFCKVLSYILFKSASSFKTPNKIHNGGTFIAMEGPAFSTKAESLLYRSWGADIIGMTVLPEAKLAREAEICYASIGLVTDYDCWRDNTAPVTFETVAKVMVSNTELAKKVIKGAIKVISNERNCECVNALATAIVTSKDKMSTETKEKLRPIIGKYI